MPVTRITSGGLTVAQDPLHDKYWASANGRVFVMVQGYLQEKSYRVTPSGVREIRVRVTGKKKRYLRVANIVLNAWKGPAPMGKKAKNTDGTGTHKYDLASIDWL